MGSSCLELPPDFEDHEREVEAKGWFSQARIVASGARYLINFYDPVRLGQQMRDELAHGQMFFEPNLIVLRAVTRANMEAAAKELLQSGALSSLIAET